MAEDRSTMVRMRLREEKDRLKMSTRDIAGILGWSQSRVGKLLTGRVGLDLNDCAALCFALGIGLTEAVRDRGVEFCAEMTPSELRFLEIFRKASQADREAVTQLLTGRVKLQVEDRRAAPPKKVVKRNVR
jgi:transcriptional regulator with XRE-family HTH domain